MMKADEIVASLQERLGLKADELEELGNRPFPGQWASTVLLSVVALVNRVQELEARLSERDP